jgi:hypothetical protein
MDTVDQNLAEISNLEDEFKRLKLDKIRNNKQKAEISDKHKKL